MLLFLRSAPVYRFFSHPSLRPPSCFVSSPSEFPRYHLAIPNHPSLLSFLPFLRFDLPSPVLPLPSLPSSPSPFPSRLCCTIPSSPAPLRRRFLSLLPSALLGFPFCPLYCSHPSLFRSHRQPSRLSCSFSFLQHFMDLVSSSKRR